MPRVITARLGRDGHPLSHKQGQGSQGQRDDTNVAWAGCCPVLLSPGYAEGFQNDGRGPGRTSRAPEPISSHFTASRWKTRSGSGQVPREGSGCARACSPCPGSLLISKLHPFGLASLWGSSLFPGTKLMEQPEQGLSEHSSSLGVLPEKPGCCRERAVAQ